MRLSLADSLEHICEQASPHLSFDAPAVAAMIAKMRAAARYPPSTFALYAELVLALAGEQHVEAQRLFAELVREVPASQPWRVLALDDAAHHAHAERYRAFLDTDPNTRFRIDAPPPDLATTFIARLRDGFRLMSTAVPELAAEFNVLVSDVVVVVGDPEAEYQFDGGSSYMLWGGLFLNAASHENEVAMVEVMAHESAHILLYGCAAEEVLVENDDDELYSSPLRLDPRPMDGIFHATFVSARMHWAMSKLAQSGRLGAQDLARATSALESDRDNFWAGYDVVARHARMTATGAQVMGSAKAYMTAACGAPAR